MQCSVLLLDGRVGEWNLPTNAVGQDLFDQVCKHLNLLERDYFGLAIFDSLSTKSWLDVSKQINKQTKSTQVQFAFSVKFYPPNPALLCEDLTRYLLCLQIRRDLLTKRLPCQSVTLIALGSYVLQSEFGPYDPERHGDTYTNNLYLAPNQNEELLKRMRERHHSYGLMLPAQADLLFLQNACQLPLYGIDRHPAKDSDGEDVVLGVCSEGIHLYRDDMLESKFLWPRVLKVSFKHSKFLLRTRPSEGSVWTLSFTLPSNRACKSLWKVAVEQYSFFRLPSVEISRRRPLALGTQFQYCGRTEAESLQASSEITRSNPAFLRKPRARSTSLDALSYTAQPQPDDWFLMLDSFPQQAFFVKGLDENPTDWKQEADDWLLFQDPSKTTQMALDAPDTLSNVETFQEDQEQGDEDSSDNIEEDSSSPGGSEEEESEEEEEEEMIEETAEEEEVVEEYTEESRQEGEIMEIRQVKEVKIVRKISREVKTVGGRLRESKDLGIIQERGRSEAFELGVLKDRLTKGGTLDQRLQGLSDAEMNSWHILFDRDSPICDPTLAAKQRYLLEQQQELMSRIIGENLEGLDISGEVRQEWEIVEEPQEKILQKGELEGETVEIRRQRLKMTRKQIQEFMVEEEETTVEEVTLSEIQQEIAIIQEQLEELVEVEETQLELEVLTEKLLEVDALEYSIQRIEQDVDEDKTKEDDWFVLLDRAPYIITPAPLVLSRKTLEVAVREGAEEAALTEAAEEQLGMREDMEQRVIVTEPITIESHPYTVREIDDDWFLLLEPVPLKDRGPVGDSVPYAAGPIYEPGEEGILEKEEIPEVVLTEEDQGSDEPESADEIATVLERKEPVVQYVEDDWFLHFDKVLAPVKTSLPVVWQTVERTLNVGPISVEVEAEEESDEEVLEERQVMEVLPPPTFTPRQVEDGWYSLLEVTPTETVRVVEPDTTGQVEVYQAEQQTFESMTVITRRTTTLVTVTEVRREEGVTIMEDQNISTEVSGEYITLEVKQPGAARHIEDDWFILLEPAPVELKTSPSAAWEQEQAAPAEDQRREEREKPVVVVEVTDVQPVIQEQRAKVTPREVEDDWYIILEVLPRETVWVAPRHAELITDQEQEEEQVTVKRVLISEEVAEIIEEKEERAQRPDVVPQEPVVVPRDIEDDWFLLFESVPVEVKAPSAALVSLQYDAERVQREKEEVEITLKRVRISEEEVVIIREIEDLITRPAVVMETPPVVPRDIEDDWFLLLESLPVEVKTPPSVAWEQVQPSAVDMTVQRDEERKRMEEKMETEIKVVQSVIQEPKFTPREVEDDWYTLLEVLPRETVPAKVEMVVEVVSTEKREERVTKQTTITEERRVVVVVDNPSVPLPPPQPVAVREIADDWFLLLDAVPLQERVAPSAVEMRRAVDISKPEVVELPKPEQKTVVQERLREQETQRIPQKIFVGVREIEDDWYTWWDKTIQLYKAESKPKVVSKPEDQRVERVSERERTKEEDLRKRVTIAEAKRVAAVQQNTPPAVRHIVDDWFILLDKDAVEYRAPPRVVPVTPPPPAKRPAPVEQPLTSTPTIHPAPIIRYTPEERRETQVIVKKKVEEDEELTIIRRKTRKIEGENIYIRHSILMLEDFDVTQEVVLRHHASISELKRLFMEAEPEEYLSEWDKHLSICHLDTHTQLISMEEWSREERVSIM